MCCHHTGMRRRLSRYHVFADTVDLVKFDNCLAVGRTLVLSGYAVDIIVLS